MKYCPKCQAQYTDDQAICPIDEVGLLVKGVTKSTEPMDPMLGRTIAEKYRIERLIGRGGMGAVYEGRHLLLERSVAIKVLHHNMTADERAAGRFIREAKASARIEHPNAVTIHDFGVLSDGSAYLIMEFIRGRSLRQILMQQNRIELKKAINIAIQVCNVVEIAHQQGIIHRDLKPENVMLKESADGEFLVKVVDFGLAKLVSGDGKESGANLTQTGEVLGTPHYMAPEYYEGETVDARADIYAIGVMLYEMLSGDAPFIGTVQSIIGGHLFKDPEPIFKYNPTVPPQINDVVQLALKKKKDERIGSTSEFVRVLKSTMHLIDGDFQTDGLPVISSGPLGPGGTLNSSPESDNIPATRIDNIPPTKMQTMQVPLANERQTSNEASGTGILKEKYKSSNLANENTTRTRETRPIEESLVPATQDVSQEANLAKGIPGKSYETRPTRIESSMPRGEVVTPSSVPATIVQESPLMVAAATKKILSSESVSGAVPELATESFFDMVSDMKKELLIASSLAAILALALVAFIIHRSESAISIKVQPLPDKSTQTQSQ